MRPAKIIFATVAMLLLVYIIGYVGIWKWGMSHRYCPVGQSLRVYRKTGSAAPKGQYAKPGEAGVREQLLGPGRHFWNPYDYTLEVVPDVEIPPGKIGVVRLKIGEELVQGTHLVSRGQGKMGMLEDVLTPGTWRVNDFGEQVALADAVIIPPGYVGVQTLLQGVEGDKKPVLDEVLTPGYYNINPQQRKVDIVEVGYREMEMRIEYDDKTGKVLRKSGVSFPLADGKEMRLDFTVIWGVSPENAPRVIREFGNIDDVQTKLIMVQVPAVCKNHGSNLTTQEFIEGKSREEFQRAVTEDLKRLGQERGIDFLVALVRGFHPAEDIKQTIQARKIAEEEKTTIAVELFTDTVAASLEEAKKRVEIRVNDFNGETEALVKEELEKGVKTAAEVRAETDRTVAELDLQTAEIEAQIVKILGEAEARVIEATKRAEADRFQQYVKAYGSGDIYNLVEFAENLPDDLTVEYRYAGPGTFWTDAEPGKRVNLRDAAARKLLQREQTREQTEPKPK